MANRIPMPPSERAKQFMPFAALKGLPEALAEKERRPEPRRELSEYMTVRLDDTLRSLTPGQIITAVYYADGRYVQLTGTVTAVDRRCRSLCMEEVPIPFDDLFELIV